MDFYFSAYSTPLLFGFVQAWIYALLLWGRGVREERLSDLLLGGILVALALNIWMYMLGFGGIEVFWQELNFFPRTIDFLLPPLVYFYLRAQFDAGFRFRPRHGWHALPFVIHTLYHLIIFAQGQAFVRYWEANVHYRGIAGVEFWVGTAQDLLYLYWSFRLYRRYRMWTTTQFSDTERISFRWFRNFLLALTVTLVVDLTVTALDSWLDLTYWEDWWGNLVGVALIYYVSIEGYAQVQVARRLHFDPEEHDGEQHETMPTAAPSGPLTTDLSPDLEAPLAHLLAYMTTERPYLDGDLSLTELARRVHLPPSALSQLINTGTGQNFNDFVNGYRVEEFKRRVREPSGAQLSFLGLALECGFNSKSTFNRAFRKATGQSPRGYVAGPQVRGVISTNPDDSPGL